MSSRALRRLERQREQEYGQSHSEDPEVDDVQDNYVEPVNKTTNIFALINGDNSDEDDVGDNDSEKEIQASEKLDETAVAAPQDVKLPTKSQKKNKKKNGKKQKQKKQDNDTVNGEDDLDKILKEMNIKVVSDDLIDTTLGDDEDEDNEFENNVSFQETDASFSYFTPLKQARAAKLLKINVKDLDPDNEFQKLFGKLSTEALEDADSTTSTSVPPEQLAQIRKLAKVIRGWGGRDRRSIPGTSRKLILTKVRDDWIPTQKKDLSMEELSTKELLRDRLAASEDWADVVKEEIEQSMKYGIRSYKFERDGTSSKIANTEFYSAVVVSPNHERLMQLLSKYPYHVETILQVALILIRQGDKSNSNGLVERALFAFDRGFKQNFDLSNGLTRLPFAYYLNRQFYLALFRYIEVLTKKGTYLTALTYTKLLLALSPADDPLGSRYFIDFYAILAGEYQYLIDLVNSPLIKTYTKWFTPGLAYSVVLAHLRLKDEKTAKISLKEAFIRHPYVGYKLLEAIGLGNDIPVKDYSVFEVGQETEISTEAYLIRAPIIWNDSSERKFLHDTLLELIEQDNLRFVPTRDGVIPDNFLRFAILSGEGKVMAKIPKEVWESNEIFEFDVLPPKYGNVETLSDFIDDRLSTESYDEERLMEMVRNLSLQELIDNGIQTEE